MHTYLLKRLLLIFPTLFGVAVVYGWTALMQATTLTVSLILVVVVVGVPAAVPPIHRRIRAVGWCVIVRHRLRVAFNEFIITNRHGSLPLILAARPTPAGERVWVWLRPGLALSDLEGRTDLLLISTAERSVRRLGGIRGAPLWEKDFVFNDASKPADVNRDDWNNLGHEGRGDRRFDPVRLWTFL